MCTQKIKLIQIILDYEAVEQITSTTCFNASPKNYKNLMLKPTVLTPLNSNNYKSCSIEKVVAIPEYFFVSALK